MEQRSGAAKGTGGWKGRVVPPFAWLVDGCARSTRAQRGMQSL